ncbi:hypothetical protein [Sphingomonas elodea]|uniref:hypothetical protein n=1 Tax=Sphingomonas elodea TaxID=179878 RepID=UPI0002631074|nr:hypothetical protein [Sphingomonas elodea]
MARLITLSACLIAGVTVAPAAIAQGHKLGGGAALNLSLTRIVLSLLLCLMLASVAALALKRTGGRFDVKRMWTWAGGSTAQRRIEVLEVRRASQHADICLIRCDEREYLVLSSHEHQVVLRERQCLATAPVGETAA